MLNRIVLTELKTQGEMKRIQFSPRSNLLQRLTLRSSLNCSRTNEQNANTAQNALRLSQRSAFRSQWKNVASAIWFEYEYWQIHSETAVRWFVGFALTIVYGYGRNLVMNKLSSRMVVQPIINFNSPTFIRSFVFTLHIEHFY